MCDAPPVVGRGEILFAVELLAGKHVPQTEFRLEAAVALLGDAAGDQRLRLDDLPIGEARHCIRVGDLFGEGCRIDRREQTAALKVVGDNGADVVCDFGLGRRAGEEIGQRNRHGLWIALRDVEFQSRIGTARCECGEGAGARTCKQMAAVQDEMVIGHKGRLTGISWNISLVSKVKSISFQIS